jgi:hypothetical protein
MSTLTPEQLGIDARRLPQCPVLIPKRKKPGGGFLPCNPETRFYIVAPMQNKQGIREEHSSYRQFNGCTIGSIVSRIPCVLGGHRRTDLEELSRTFYRWDKRNLGTAPSEYLAPPHLGAFCSTQSARQNGSEVIAKRWRGEDYEEILCPGDRCEFTTAPGDKRPPCLKVARLWFWPQWSTLADQAAADPTTAKLSEAIRLLPDSPLKLQTGGAHAPSIVNWNSLLASVQAQAKALELWPCSLLGLPFWVGVNLKKGKGKRYTVYTFELAGSVQSWLAEQQKWRQAIDKGKRFIVIGPGAESEQEPAAFAADMLQITETVIPSRPATVADLKPSTSAECEQGEGHWATGEKIQVSTRSGEEVIADPAPVISAAQYKELRGTIKSRGLSAASVKEIAERLQVTGSLKALTTDRYAEFVEEVVLIEQKKVDELTRILHASGIDWDAARFFEDPPLPAGMRHMTKGQHRRLLRWVEEQSDPKAANGQKEIGE